MRLPSAVGRCSGAFLLAAVLCPAQPAAPPSKSAPVINWRVPTFTADGSREWTVSGSEATLLDRNTAAVREINVTVFAPDAANLAESIIVSPDALVRLDRKLVTGQSTVRVVNKQFEASGTGWSYDQNARKITLARNARVTFRAELNELLK